MLMLWSVVSYGTPFPLTYVNRTFRSKFDMLKFVYRKLSKCDVAGVGTAAAGAMSAGASIYAADRQFEATQATNRANERMAFQRNQLEYQMFGEANEFNAEQAELSRQHSLAMQHDAQEYNSLPAQVQRAQQAHINPAAVLGQSTSVGVNSSSAQAQSVTPPNMVAAQMQTPDLSALQGVAQAFANIGSTMESFARARNINADTQSKMTYNKFQSQILQSGLDVDKAKIREAYVHAEEMQNSINQIQETVRKTQTEITLLGKQGNLIDEQTFSLNIENAFKGKEMELHIKNLQAILGYNETQAKWAAETLAARIYGVKLQNQLTYEQVGLTKEQADYFDNLASLTYTNNEQAAFDYQTNRFFSRKERRLGLRLGQAALEGADWDNSTPVKFLREAEGIVTVTANAVQTAATVKNVRTPRARARRSRQGDFFEPIE